MLISDLPYLEEILNNKERVYGGEGITIAAAGRAIAFAFTDEPGKTVYSKARVYALAVNNGWSGSFVRIFANGDAGVLQPMQ
jgi:hypothetical protein